jgi:hypothetical protein
MLSQSLMKRQLSADWLVNVRVHSESNRIMQKFDNQGIMGLAISRITQFKGAIGS